MDDFLSFREALLARVQGPMPLRLLLQPLTVIFFALRDGRHDARRARAPFLRVVFTDPAQRSGRLREAWRSVGKVFIIATVLDLIFQYSVFREFRPVGALIAGASLAILPYLLLRGAFCRLFGQK